MVARLSLTIALAAAFLALVPSAAAIPPALLSVGSQDRHPTATFSAPKSDHVVIQIATRPDRASDGEFLSENVEVFDVMNDSEIQSGRWLYGYQLDPGSYWVLLRASPDFDLCYVWGTGGYDPSCADGYANMQALTIPRPAIRYSGAVRRYSFLSTVDARITATPLGEKVPYRVCFGTKSGGRRCLNGTLAGYSWSSSATDTLEIGTRNLRPLTTFTWYVAGKAVVSKRARVR